MRAIRSQIKDERFYATKNEPVKRGKSKMQERRDNWRCDARAEAAGQGVWRRY